MSRISKFAGLVSLMMVMGCSGGASPPPTEEKISELNAKMDADMKAMTQQIPKNVPKK